VALQDHAAADGRCDSNPGGVRHRRPLAVPDPAQLSRSLLNRCQDAHLRVDEVDPRLGLRKVPNVRTPWDADILPSSAIAIGLSSVPVKPPFAAHCTWSCRYNTFCVDVPNSPCAPTLQFQMHADACTGAPSTPTPAHTQADAAAHGHTKHAIFRPQGILYGGRGPFLVCSNGRDALWYHFSPPTEADTRSESESLPYTTTILRLADVPAKHGKPSQGCRKVFFAGTKLVDLWTDFHDKQRTLTVMEPTRKLIDTMGLNGELHSLAHCDCIHGRLPSVGQAH